MQEAINVWTRWDDGLMAVQLRPVQNTQRKSYIYESAEGTPAHSLSELLGRKAEVCPAAYFRLGLLETVSATDLWPELRPIEAPAILVPRGIDFSLKYKDIEKLLRAGFMGKILAAGFEFKDVLQEVYMGLLVRNQGECPWDPSKGSFSHYVWMCIDSILTNYHRKMRIKHSAVGSLEDLDTDPMDKRVEMDNPWIERKRLLQKALAEDRSEEARWAEELLRLQLEGYKRADLLAMGWTQSKQTRAMKKLRSLARPS